MSGQHNLHNHQIAIKFHHETFRRIEIAAEEHKMTPGEFIRWVVTERVHEIQLTAKDALLIARRIKEAEKKGTMV